ncbi:MAG: hypothetical protein J3K34DRAFT_120836 [Monoraphidium minutum]|nr:MAG: hypothetical protein J3K34DRAFT_120836 [Monoraphidium minutum]
MLRAQLGAGRVAKPPSAPRTSLNRCYPTCIGISGAWPTARGMPRASGPAAAAASGGGDGADAAAAAAHAAAGDDASPLLSATLDEEEAEARAAAAGGRSWGALRPRTRAYRVLGQVNESTKWVVAGLVGVVLVAAHNEWAAWAVVGAVLSSFLCKALKRVINEQRPADARKKDPGMPSSHANSLNFLSVTAAMSLAHHAGGQPAAAALAALTLAAGLFLTWLRVALGYHTWPQVAVGGLLGASTAAAWSAWGSGRAVPALQAWPPGVPLLYVVNAAGVAAFVVRNVLQWRKERQEGAAARGGKARASDADAGQGGGGWAGAPATAAG